MKTPSSSREWEADFWSLLPCTDPSFHIWKGLRLYFLFLLLCLFLYSSQQLTEVPSCCGYEHQGKSPFPSCRVFTQRKREENCVPHAALGPSLLSTPEKLSLPFSHPMLRRVLEQGGKSHSSVHQKIKGITYALNLHYMCLYQCHQFMTTWIYCVLALSL